ncbi:hypothetical protein ACFWR9_34585 [Streptomyces sp. NPDC058534]|uniref:hypothetical protein n=1 Tax=Streptomyces sp. NPDC058534 TaxID=3346541 RepID=UPI00364A107F
MAPRRERGIRVFHRSLSDGQTPDRWTATARGRRCARPRTIIITYSAIGTGEMPPMEVMGTGSSHAGVPLRWSAPEVSSWIHSSAGAWPGPGKTPPVCRTRVRRHTSSGTSAAFSAVIWVISSPGTRSRRRSSQASEKDRVLR